MQTEQAAQQAKAMQSLGNTPIDNGSALSALVRGGGFGADRQPDDPMR